MDKIPIFTATKKDFKIDWFNGTGPGGQNRNKTKNCCRITHIESGFTETGQQHRERTRNQKEAFNRLAKRLVEHYTKKEKRERYTSTEVIRTYNEPDNRVTDHLSKQQITYKEFEKDGIDKLIDSRLECIIIHENKDS